MVRALFARPLEQATSGSALVLDVEVLAFDELVRDAGHAGQVVVRYEIHGTQPVIVAIGALTEASDELADRVVGAICVEGTAQPSR